MITGFNTDVKVKDTVYHVQTEDQGTANPLIESLIYVKGAILDSHRTYYAAFLNSGDFKEGLLQRILESQHRQIVGAIRKGKYQKGMLLEDFVDGDFSFCFHTSMINATTESREADAPADLTETPLSPGSDSHPPARDQSPSQKNPLPIHPADAPLKARFLPADFEISPASTLSEAVGIEIVVKGSKEFKAGSHVELDLCVQTRHDKARLENVQVLVKVIGTTFTPRLYAGKTDKTGSLRMTFSLPTFTVGSAALILQATTSAGGDEIKYLIRRR